jgi:exodeoxyribonuclease VII large subunit
VLWDDPDVGRLPDPTYSVGELADRLSGALHRAFPDEVWVRGEIHDLSRPASGHVYFTLVDSAGDRQACLSVILSAGNKERVNRALKRSGGAVRMTDGTEVRIRGRVDFYAARGQLQLRMTAIDAEYTLGALELARAELLRRLDQEGLLRANARHELPLVPLRVGLVTSAGSAAEADALHELERSGFAFRVLVAPTVVQGPGAPASVAASISAGVARGVDVVAVVRGGGARTDLAAFDDERVARAIAGCPVPVLTGIGHEIDRSGADDVAHTAAKTPTACAGLLVEQVQRYLARIDDLWASTARTATRGIGLHRQRVTTGSQRAVRAARHALRTASGSLDEAARRSRRGASVALDRADSALEQAEGRVAGASRQHLRAAELAVGGASQRVAQRAPRSLATAVRHLDGLDAQVRALDPARTMARGWSITRRGDDGLVVRAPDDAPPGTELRTTVAGGELRSRVEGAVGTPGTTEDGAELPTVSLDD